jgi:hypothetical protein
LTNSIFSNKFLQSLLRRLGKPIDNNNINFQTEILCPQEISEVCPATYIEEHLSRITGSNEHTSLENEHATLLSREIKHSPTILLQIDNVRLFGGGIYSTDRNCLPRRVIENQDLPPVNLAKALLVDNDITQTYFGHWFTDQISSALVATPEMPALALNTPKYTHALGYEEIFQTATRYAQHGRVDQLYWLSDFSQNSYKVKRYQQLRQRAEQFLLPESSSSAGVYIARGNSGTKRTLVNEQELINHLIDRGFTIIHPEAMTPEMIVRSLWNAPVVISVEGSQIAHTIHTISRSACVLILMPPNRVSHIFKGIFDAIGNIAYGFYVCATTNDVQGFYVDSFSDLDNLIERLKDSAARRG